MRSFLIIVIITLFSCSEPVNKTINITIPKYYPTVTLSADSLTAIIKTDRGLSGYDTLSTIASSPISIEHLIRLVEPSLHDSSASMFVGTLSESLPIERRLRKLNHLAQNNGYIKIEFSLDTALVFTTIRQTINQFNAKEPINHLFDPDGAIPDFTAIVPATSLILPCKGLDIPTRADLLPNSPRVHRSGLHRGIDFQANWGTPIRSVADGIVIRSDLNYKEVKPDFRVEMLRRTATLGRTPSDIFNELLLGQAVIIDHGFDLFPGFRVITIYAHLSYIKPNIKPGYIIKSGEIFAKSGNTGSSPSTLGSRDQSHLHWELILQDSRGEYYFGQALGYDALRDALNELFQD